ncbi:lipoprotein NlpI [Moritella sp. Urea-trap-13]|uniref:lipoprotein NlpI n=1 Tax=Moritella sp. Urea-trap-13 TaxID=2058327 RepID=UPI000C329224|nr:lipoprotein NlpI [Moritella sp. Urea-trap-13]PKH05211.1 lipoprotein NlpI [Moritella sp. Urea-trap-13]
MKRCLSLLIATALLSGCSSLSGSFSTDDRKPSELILAEPLQVNYQTEIMLMRYSQLILDAKDDRSRQARYFYERGLLADSMGLRSLAHADFQRSLTLQPDFVPAYNFIGLYMTQTEQFDEAFDAYDSIAQLDPENNYVFLNRGIALYYGERYGLAINDLVSAYNEAPNDPFRTLWLYYPEYQVNAEEALKSVQARYNQHIDDVWSWNIVALYTQELSETQLLAKLLDGLDKNDPSYNKILAHRLTETYFYLGKYKALMDDDNAAESYFKLALSNNVYEFIEHGYARLELSRLANKG